MYRVHTERAAKKLTENAIVTFSVRIDVVDRTTELHQD